MIEIGQLMGDLGVMIVISALFVYLFWWQSRKQQQNYEKLLGYIMTSNKKNIKDDYTAAKEAHETNLQLRIKINEEVYDKLQEVCLKTDAQRACIFEFHNSSENFCGLPFAKFSTTYEYIEKGVTPIAQTWQNFPFAMLTPILTDLQSRGYCKVDDIDKINDRAGLLYNILKTNHTNKVLFSGMFDSKNQLIGILMVEHENDFVKEDLKIIKEATISFQTIVTTIKETLHNKK